MNRTNQRPLNVSRMSYSQIEDEAWATFNNHIAYSTTRTNCELVELTGRFAGKQAIKIPISQNLEKSREFLEEHFGVKIASRSFGISSFSMPRPDGYRQKIAYNVYFVTALPKA